MKRKAWNRAEVWASLRGGLAAVVWLAAAQAIGAQGPAENPAAACAAKNQADAATVGQYLFKTYKSDDGACLEVTTGGKVVYSQSVDSYETYTLGQPGDAEEHIPEIANGTDVTERGQPDMIVSLFTGGAHCCRIHYVFELKPKFKLLATIQDAADGFAYFTRDQGDAHYYFLTGDWTFDYWPSPSYGSPNAPIVLRFMEDAKGGGFHLASEKMKKPAPTEKEWNEKLSDAQDALDPADVNSPAILWDTVLNLIYTGHSDLAWKFVDAMGPKAQQKPFPSLADFCAILKQSPYWPDLEPTLKDMPAACANAPAKKAE